MRKLLTLKSPKVVCKQFDLTFNIMCLRLHTLHNGYLWKKQYLIVFLSPLTRIMEYFQFP